MSPGPPTTASPADAATPAPPATGGVDRPALAAVAVTVVAWATAFVAIRALGPSVGPGPLALGRVAVAAVVLGAVLAVRGGWVRPTAREWRLLAVCGVTWFAAYNVALNAGERLVDAGTAALLVAVCPLLIILLAGLLLGEGFPRALLVGAGVALCGTTLITLGTANAPRVDELGVVLCLLAAVTWAIGVMAQKPLLARVPPLQVTFWCCVIGALATAPFAPALVGDLTSAPLGASLGVLYLGLVPQALAFGTWAFALSRMDAGRLGVTTYLVAPLVVLLSWPVLQETPPLLALLGGALSLTGVALSRRAARPAAADARPEAARPPGTGPTPGVGADG